MRDALFFLAGLAMLLVGGRLLVSAAVGAAARLGVPPLLVGLTLVAWGTSCPELAFNLTSAFQNKPDLVFGNVVGANICNLGLVLGVAALIAPLAVSSAVVRREMPLMVGMFGLMLITAETPAIQHALAGRLEPVILLVAFAAYSVYVIYEGLTRRTAESPLAQQTREAEVKPAKVLPMWMLGALFVGGIALLGVGGNFASDAASGIARALGMSDRVVGLTVVALGTTMPELVTSVLAIRQKQVDLAVGNAVGSCLFNAGAIFGLCQAITPAPTPEGSFPSLVCMALLGVLLIPFSRTHNGHIARVEGIALLLIQAGFIAFEVWRTRGK